MANTAEGATKREQKKTAVTAMDADDGKMAEGSHGFDPTRVLTSGSTAEGATKREQKKTAVTAMDADDGKMAEGSHGFDPTRVLTSGNRPDRFRNELPRAVSPSSDCKYRKYYDSAPSQP